MIFSDKDTASEFREIAVEQLQQDIREAIEYGAKHHARILIDDTEWKEFLLDRAAELFVENIMRTRVYATMIMRSGIVFSSKDSASVHSMILYYDNDSANTNDDRVAQAMQENNHRMFGGIDKITGTIHT